MAADKIDQAIEDGLSTSLQADEALASVMRRAVGTAVRRACEGQSYSPLEMRRMARCSKDWFARQLVQQRLQQPAPDVVRGWRTCATPASSPIKTTKAPSPRKLRAARALLMLSAQKTCPPTPAKRQTRQRRPPHKM